MSDVTVGYYAHHHGRGHMQRALAIARAMPCAVTILSSAACDEECSPNVSFVRLPLDYDANAVPESFDRLHYAPLGVSGLRARARIVTEWFDTNWPCVLIVDVSVEIAMLARLSSVPVIYVRQRGDRFDSAHQFAYASASSLLAPYPEMLEEPGTPDRWRAKTDYVGLVSRYGEDDAMCEPERRRHHPRRTGRGHAGTVAVVVGYGGTAIDGKLAIAAAVACPDWKWSVLGPVEPIDGADVPENLVFVGTVVDPRSWLIDADIVVGSGGDSLVSEIADLRCRFVCVPDSRPYGEQRSTARLLHAAGCAIGLKAWPDASDWPQILQDASMLDGGGWAALSDGHGAERAASAILTVAESVLKVMAGMSSRG